MDRSSLLRFAALVCVASTPLLALACGGSAASGVEPSPRAESNKLSEEAKVHCTGILPPLCEVCSDGETACAHWVVVDGKCEERICPVPKVTECKGALPDICEICSNGASACAHWVIVDGACEVQICPPGESPMPISSPAPTATPLGSQ